MKQSSQYLPEPFRAETAARSGSEGPGLAPPVQWFRIGSGHFFLSASSRDWIDGTVIGEMQSVVVALRWEPIDGQLFGLISDPDAGRGPTRTLGRIASDNRGSRETWRMTAGSEVQSWLADRLPGRPGTEESPRSLYLLELCSCLAGGSGPHAASQSELEALARYKARGGRSIHAREGAFFWFRTYHLALAEAVASEAPDPAASRWRVEGGIYPPTRALLPGPWRRRAAPAASLLQDENRRPADSFDSRASYLIEGPATSSPGAGAVDQSGLPLAGLPLARFRPFLTRLAPLSPWSLGQSGKPEAGAIGLSFSNRQEAGGLAAWYSRVAWAPLLTWRHSPPLLHGRDAAG